MSPDDQERAAVLLIRDICADLSAYAAKLARHGADHKDCEREDVNFIERSATRLTFAMTVRDTVREDRKRRNS